MARKIVLTSGKGGVGKTTVCANLGATLAKFGFRVVIIDVDRPGTFRLQRCADRHRHRPAQS